MSICTEETFLRKKKCSMVLMCNNAKETGREQERQRDWTEGFEHTQGLEAL